MSLISCALRCPPCPSGLHLPLTSDLWCPCPPSACRLQLGHGPQDGGPVSSSPTRRLLPSTSGASGPVLRPAGLAAAAVRAVRRLLAQGPGGSLPGSCQVPAGVRTSVDSLLVPRYTLTVWTGQRDQLSPQDLLAYQQVLDRSRIYYDLPPSLRTPLGDGGQDSQGAKVSVDHWN